jgi:hypothetical protein
VSPSRSAASALVFLAGALLAARPAAAQVTTDRGASILVYPKIVADGSADTAVQLVNLSDNRIDASCAYLSGAAGNWQALTFAIALSPSRPLHWAAASGHTAGAGEDPNDIPAAPAAFRGSLLCVQVDGTGAPFSGNELAGQALLTDLASGDVSGYPAAGLGGSGLNDGDEFLCIGGEGSDNCPLGAEYDSCPAEWIVSLPAEGAVDAQLGASSQLSTHLTVVPCSQNLRDTMPGSVDIGITVFNELGQQFTGEVSVTCWADLSLADVGAGVFTRATLGTDYAEARLAPMAGSGGFFLLAQTTRTSSGAEPVAAADAVVPQHRGSAAASDLIVLPMGSAP